MKHLLTRYFILFVLVCLPILASYSIGRHLGMQAVLYFSFLCVLFLPYFIINNIAFRKIYWFIITIFTFAWSITEVGHYVQEKSPYNEEALKIFYESNLHELVEYTLTIVPIYIIIIVLIIIFLTLYFIFRAKHFVYHFTKIQYWLILSILILGSSYYLFFANNIGDKAGFLKDEYVSNQNLKNYYKSLVLDSTALVNNIIQENYQLKNPTTKNTYVLIIGESTSRHHFGVYNYIRNTTPLISKNKNLNFFTDVISSNSSTVECLSKCLTFKNNNTNTHNFSNINILDIANTLGFNTYWLSNQAHDGIFYNSITLGVARVKNKYFIETDSQFKNIAANNRFDIYLLPQLQKALKDSTQNKLIVLHLMGTHFQFKNRYSALFNKFKTDSSLIKRFPYANNIKKLQSINEYDNAVLYQDFFLDSVFKILDKIPNAQAIYFSDHGEEVYDYRNFIGHTPQGGNPWLHDIPFITYRLSDSLLLNKNSAYQMDNFCYAMCSWMNITCNNFSDEKSIFSKNLFHLHIEH